MTAMKVVLVYVLTGAHMPHKIKECGRTFLFRHPPGLKAPVAAQPAAQHEPLARRRVRTQAQRAALATAARPTGQLRHGLARQEVAAHLRKRARAREREREREFVCVCE